MNESIVEAQAEAQAVEQERGQHWPPGIVEILEKRRDALAQQLQDCNDLLRLIDSNEDALRVLDLVRKIQA